jgi:hypothetical protein
VNWAATSQRLLLRRGAIGQIRRGRLAFVAEVRSLAHVLGQTVGRTFQASCDAALGDARCGVNLEGPAFKGTGAVIDVLRDRAFTASGLASFAAGWFAFGLVEWSTGANAGRRVEVLSHDLVDGVAILKDLQTQRSAIMEQIAPHDPDEALALLWRFMGLATPVFERCDDSSGTVIDIFHQACDDLGEVAKAAGAAPEALARQVLDALQDNGFGQYDGLIAIIAPALGPDGVAHLKALVEELGRTPVPVPPKSEWQAVGWGSGGTRYAHEMEERARQNGFTSAAVAGAMVASHFSATVSSAGGTTRFLGVTRMMRPSMPFWVRSASRAADRVVSEIAAPLAALLP